MSSFLAGKFLCRLCIFAVEKVFTDEYREFFGFWNAGEIGDPVVIDRG